MDRDPQTGFLFQDQLPSSCSSDALIVRIPAGIREKQTLLECLAAGLRFPGYFGWNWDALDECLRDLSWIEHPRQIVLWHGDVPFEPNSNDQATYLDILKDAVAAWGPNQLHEFIVIFPP